MMDEKKEEKRIEEMNEEERERERRLTQLKRLMLYKCLDPADPCGYYWIHFYVSIYRDRIKEFQYYDDFVDLAGFYRSRKLDEDINELKRRGFP